MTRWDREDPYPAHLLGALTALGLTVVEAEITALIGTGWTFSAIARARGCRQSTVYESASNAATKLRVSPSDDRPVRRVLTMTVLKAAA